MVNNASGPAGEGPEGTGMMRLRRLIHIVVGLFVVAGWTVPACGQDHPPAAGARVPGADQADVHNPFSPGYVDMTPDGPTSFYFYHGPYPYGVGYGFPYLGGYGAWYYDPYWAGPFVLPPLVVPAEAMYGPQAVRRFYGADQPVAARSPVRQAVGGGFGVLAPLGNGNPDRPKVRVANGLFVARALTFVTFGDMHFRRQKYSDAYQRYKKAAAAAPDLGDVYFRQGFSLVAMSRYESAAKAFKRGLALDPGLARSEFRLDQVYGENQLAKNAHLEALADAAAEQPDDGDLMFLVGVLLYFDDQPERSRIFFLRARDLSGGDEEHLAGFFKELAPAQAGGDENPAGVEL